MCRVTLSRPVPVAALVGRYPTKLIGHGPIPDRRDFAGSVMRHHRVIGYYRRFRKGTEVRRYPRVQGTLSMYSSPVRR